MTMASEQSRGGINVRDVASSDFVIAYAAHLKRIGKIEVPKWADLVKTAAFKELGPYDPDWYYIRAGISTLCGASLHPYCSAAPVALCP